MVIVCLLIQLYLFVVFVRILMSWFPPTPGTTYAQVYEALDRVTEPVLAPIRAAIPPVNMGAARLDLSPIVVFLAGALLTRFLC
ncbi:MAG TPA: YggT family protein [Acidimicrobiales bacterium]|nr:YggT family protein [Acidimicrobiales bacterium]